MPRHHLVWILLGALICSSGVVRAQGATAGSSQQPLAQTLAERQRLRTELARVNAEIDSLKRESRSLRDDYRLRNRMADAESLARRLTELDAHLPAGATSRAGQPVPVAPAPIPEASPSDDRAVLEAKADLLADQARRMNSQADALAVRVKDLRDRNELRRRAGQLERDPFSSLEQAKRRLASATGSGTATDAVSKGGTTPTVSTPGPPEQRGDTSNGVTPTTGGGTMTPAVTGQPTVGTTSTPGVTTVTGSSSTSSSGSKAQPSLVAPSQSGDAPGSVAMQFRGILDASTLAEIRRLEVAGTPGSSLSAMEHALGALRARAAQLSAKARALRAGATAAP